MSNASIEISPELYQPLLRESGLIGSASGGTLTSGNGNITCTVSGTPSSADMANFAISIAELTCSFYFSVGPGVVTTRTILFLEERCTLQIRKIQRRPQAY